jgi:cellulose synthase/poly-beta-1,6-N-acetylglucosamine synthase-like glycosyltransferase
MSEIFGYIFLIAYLVALSYVTFYCLMSFHLLYNYKKSHWNDEGPKDEELEKNDFPFVTIQLPIYNELYVVERLIESICEFDYPKDRYEVHVLDDSTDETVEITRKKVAEYKDKGFLIKHIRRADRVGYKAGALKAGMKYAKGEFIAIFDADFLPKKNFLKKTIPFFKNNKVGVVQTRWEHINEDYSLITRLQAFQLNVHFRVEQVGRKAGNYMLQFNGTAGVWRRECIDDAGGWEADTLTEDLDLSYRAQLNGWEIVYLENVGSPAELPAEMNGLKSQQHRWMKGGAETAKKMLPSVWKSNLNFGQKVHASLHLLSSSVFLFVFLIGISSVPLIFYLGMLKINAAYFAFFLIGLLSIIAIYYTANVHAEDNGDSYLKSLLKFMLLFPVFLALSMGLSFHNSIAVLQGYLGKKSPFVRTPKFAISTGSDTVNNKKYLAEKIPMTTILEGILAIYFFAAVLGAIYYENTTFIVFHILLMLGYGTICYYSIRHLRLK